MQSFSEHVEKGHLHIYDMIQVSGCSGNLNLGSLRIEQVNRPASIQLQVKEIIGDPKPFWQPSLVSTRKRKENSMVTNGIETQNYDCLR